MGPPQIVAWTVKNFQLGDRRRSIALGNFVWGLLRAGVVSFAAIGRKVAGPATEASKIARLFNWCHNPLIDPKAVQEALFRLLLWLPGVGHLVGAIRYVLLTIDWHHYDVGDECSLRVSLVVGSRAIPLMWRDVKSCDLKGRQRAIEDEVLEDLIRLQPVGLVWVLLLDCGFRCSKRIRRMKEVFYFVQRTNGRDNVHSPAFCWTEPRNLGVQVGQVVDFGWVLYTRNDPVEVRLVATYAEVVKRSRRRRANKKGPGKRQDEGWFLLTNLGSELFPALQIVTYYARRFECEHNFRDLKNASLGMDMEHVHLLESSTYERLMCIVAVSSVLLWLYGSEAEANGWAAELSPSRPKRPRRILSLVNVGQLKAAQVRRSIRCLINRHLIPALERVHVHVGHSWLNPAHPHLQLQQASWHENEMLAAPRTCTNRKKRVSCRPTRIEFTGPEVRAEEVQQLVA